MNRNASICERLRGGCVCSSEAEAARSRAAGWRDRPSRARTIEPWTHVDAALTGNAERRERLSAWAASARTANGGESGENVAEQWLARPAGGKVEPQAARCAMHSRTDFE